MDAAFYITFCLSLTTLLLMQTMFLKDFDDKDAAMNGNGTSIRAKCTGSKLWESKRFDKICYFWYDEEMRYNITGNDDWTCGFIFLNKWNGTQLSCEDTGSSPEFYAFYTFYALATGCAVALLIREFLQMIYNGEHYWRSKEEILEILRTYRKIIRNHKNNQRKCMNI